MGLRRARRLAFAALLAGCGSAGAVTNGAPEGGAPGPGAEGGVAPPPSGDASPDPGRDGGACGGGGPVGDRTVTISSGGQSRTFDLHVPAGYDGSKPVPLVLAFHGFTMPPGFMATTTGFAKIADERHFIVAFPNGIGASFNAGDCCTPASTSNVDDLGFARDAIANIEASYCIDQKRVFSTGFSNGGFLSYKLACELSGTIAAIASVSGVLGMPPETCNPTRKVPVLHVHGTGDVVVPYNGGGIGNFRSVAVTVGAFETKNACIAGAGTVVYSKTDVSCSLWDPCVAGADVELCTITNGPHEWPGGFGSTGTKNLDTTNFVMDFLEAHPMP